MNLGEVIFAFFIIFAAELLMDLLDFFVDIANIAGELKSLGV